MLKIYFKRWCICSKVVFSTIDISSTIRSFNSDRINLNCVLIRSDIGGAKSPDSFGIDKAVCIVVPLRSLRCRRFRGGGDVTAQVDWARGCRSRAKINLLKILMTASTTSLSALAVFSEIQSLLFVAWLHLKIFDISFFTTCFRREIQVSFTTSTLALT